MTPRVAILGPFETGALRPYLNQGQDLDAMPPGMGGSCLVNLVLARLENKLPTDVITLDPTAVNNMIRYDGNLVRLWVIRRRPRKALRDGYRQEVNGILDALAESKPDICHANWTYEYGRAAIKQQISPRVITVHDHAQHMLFHLGWKYFPHYIMSRNVIRRGGNLSAVSPHISSYIKRVRGIEAVVIPNVLSSLVWQKTETQTTSTVTLVSALTWAPFRNAERALRAFARIKQTYPAAIYKMMGSGFEPDGPANQWAIKHNLARGVIFMGRVPYQSALDEIASASLVLHPSLEESFGGPVAEAMALRIPVIAARESGGPAWLLENHPDRLVAGKSIDAMTDAILRDIGKIKTQDAGLKKELAAARTRIHTLCSPESVLEKWGQYFQDILNKAL